MKKVNSNSSKKDTQSVKFGKVYQKILV